VGRDGDRVPVWPPGVVGSITHCDGYRAAAVAEDHDIGAIGIDAEPNRALKPAVARLALRPAEVRHLVPLERDEPGLAWSALVFCAKEAVYKAWYPTERRPLGFHDVEVNFEPVGRSFLAWVLVADRTPLRLSGRYACEDGLLVAAVVVKASLLKR
jgi:4'-phosphopantetheinyl transferase EntD